MSDLLEPLRNNPTSAAVFTDVDGALAPIVADPTAAAVPTEVRRTLTELGDVYALVACVSGRRVEQALRMVQLPQLAYAGNHGFEMRGPGPDAQVVASPELHGREHEAADFLASLDPVRLRTAGIHIEDKGAIQALHWRAAADQPAAEKLAGEIAEEAERGGMNTHHGRKVLELRPAVDLNKGTAVLGMARASGVRHAFYGGDDRTDLDAFRALRRLRDEGSLETVVCVGITSAEGPVEIAAEADLTVAGTEEYAAILRSLVPSSR